MLPQILPKFQALKVPKGQRLVAGVTELRTMHDIAEDGRELCLEEFELKPPGQRHVWCYVSDDRSTGPTGACSTALLSLPTVGHLHCSRCDCACRRGGDPSQHRQPSRAQATAEQPSDAQLRAAAEGSASTACGSQAPCRRGLLALTLQEGQDSGPGPEGAQEVRPGLQRCRQSPSASARSPVPVAVQRTQDVAGSADQKLSLLLLYGCCPRWVGNSSAKSLRVCGCRNEPFSAEETELLIDMIERHTSTSWALIRNKCAGTCLESRSDMQLKVRALALPSPAQDSCSLSPWLLCRTSGGTWSSWSRTASRGGGSRSRRSSGSGSGSAKPASWAAVQLWPRLLLRGLTPREACRCQAYFSHRRGGGPAQLEQAQQEDEDPIES